MSVLPWRSTLLRFPCRYQKAIQRTRMRFLVGPAYDPHGPLILTLQEVPDDCVRFGWIGLDICQTGPAEIAEHQVQGRGLGTRGSPLTTTGISLISVLPQVNDKSIAAGRTMTFSRHERGDREQTNDPVFRNVLLTLAFQWRLAARKEVAMQSTQPKTANRAR